MNAPSSTYFVVLSKCFGELNQQEFLVSFNNLIENVKKLSDRVYIFKLKRALKEEEFFSLARSTYSIRYFGRFIDALKLSSRLSLDQRKEFIKSIPWYRFYVDPFSVRKIITLPKQKYLRLDHFLPVKSIADIIWHELLKYNISPRVNLSYPRTSFDFLISENLVVVGVNSKEGNKSFLARANELRPGKHPTTIKPELARAMINLLGLINEKTNEVSIVDPLAGSGGFIVELLELRRELNAKAWKVFGNDIKQEMVWRMIKNIEFFGYHDNIILSTLDFRKINAKFDYLITDVPYGKHSFLKDDLDELLEELIYWISKHINRRSVIMFPSENNNVVDIAIRKVENLRLMFSTSIYVHKSLTRKIYLLEILN